VVVAMEGKVGVGAWDLLRASLLTWVGRVAHDRHRTPEGIEDRNREFVFSLFQCIGIASRQLEAEELAEFLKFHRGVLNRVE